ncbi:hypothetical protein STEG23_027989, partial [Scotinomys teguina]
MSGGQQLQLAALWPWLLMVTLHAGFGHPGLVLATAVESERSAEQRAIIRVIPLKMDPTGKLNLTLEGVFAGVAELLGTWNCKGPKRALDPLDPLDLGLQTIVSCHVDAGNQVLVLWKSGQGPAPTTESFLQPLQNIFNGTFQINDEHCENRFSSPFVESSIPGNSAYYIK